MADEWFRRTPEGAWIARSAVVVADVTLGDQCSVWFGAAVRGDVAPVTLGRRVNIQDGAVVHCDTGYPNELADEVSVGHRAVVHGEYVGAGTLIGMGAVVLGHTRIGSQCLIAAGAVVPQGLAVPDRKVVMGVPGKIVRDLRESELEYLRWVSRRYVELCRRYEAGEFGAAPT